MRTDIRTLLARILLASALAAGPGSTQTLDLASDSGLEIEDTAAASDGGLWLYTRTRIALGNDRNTLQKLSPTLAIEFERDLPPQLTGSMAPFGDGVLFIERGARPADFGSIAGFEDDYRLLWIRENPLAPRQTLHRWSTRESPRLREDIVPAFDSSAVYFASPRRDTLLSRIAPDGTVEWQRALRDNAMESLVATPDGVIAVQVFRDPASRRRGVRLEALSPAGDPLWEHELLLADAETLERVAFIAPQTLVLVPALGQEHDPRLTLIDLVDRSARSVTMPALSANIRAAAGGLLHTGYALDQPLLWFMDAGGTTAWMRQLQLTAGARFSNDGNYRHLDLQALGSGGLALIASWSGADRRDHSRIIATDSAAQSLALEHGRCLSADAVAIESLQRGIWREYGIPVRLGSPAVAARPTDAAACTLPSDAGYREFLAGFAAELARLGAGRRNYTAESIAVAVDAIDEAYRLIHYRFNQLISDAPGSEIRYLASPDAAQSLARHIVGEIELHLQHMRELVNEFRDVSDCWLRVEWNALPLAAVDDAYYADLEAAAAQAVAAAGRVAPGILERIGDTEGRCSLSIDRDRIGTRDAMLPLCEAQEAVRAALERSAP